MNNLIGLVKLRFMMNFVIELMDNINRQSKDNYLNEYTEKTTRTRINFQNIPCKFLKLQQVSGV